MSSIALKRKLSQRYVRIEVYIGTCVCVWCVCVCGVCGVVCVGVIICIHASLVCVHFDVVFLWLDGWLGACVCMYGCDHTMQMLFVCQ